jgi:predicted Holliday junction resolvase-like endonuclease
MDKIKNYALIVLAGIVTLLTALVFGRKNKWAKDVERKVDERQKEIKVDKKELKDSQEVIKEAEKDAEVAVKSYKKLKDKHDKKIEEMEGADAEKITGNDNVGNALNDLLKDLHSQ